MKPRQIPSVSDVCTPTGQRSVLIGVIFIMLGVTSMGCARQQAQAALAGISNPLIEQRADPWCMRHTDGFYYFTATAPEYDRIELRRAKTVAGLASAEVKVIWRKHDSGPMSCHIWAPEIHYVDGKWYIYFAASRADDIWAIRIYVLECAAADPLAGQWVEKGQLKTDWESFSLDATTFAHRGVRYLVWAQKDPNIRGNTNLYIAKMDSPCSIVSPQVMITKPEYPWEQILFWVNEGPARPYSQRSRLPELFGQWNQSQLLHGFAHGGCRRRFAGCGLMEEIARTGLQEQRGQQPIRPGTQQLHRHT